VRCLAQAIQGDCQDDELLDTCEAIEAIAASCGADIEKTAARLPEWYDEARDSAELIPTVEKTRGIALELEKLIHKAVDGSYVGLVAEVAFWHLSKAADPESIFKAFRSERGQLWELESEGLARESALGRQGTENASGGKDTDIGNG
jgi:hypothetical protein